MAGWAPHPTEGYKLLFVFDGGAIAEAGRAQITPDSVKISEYAFYDEEAATELAGG